MQEHVRQADRRTTYVTAAWHLNDNRNTPLAMGRSWFPEDAVARIYKPSRSVMTSGKARTKGWRLTFERRTPPFIEPLMGWTGGDDTLTQVELSFPTREAAICYAERQGLRYTVQSADGAADRKRRVTGSAHAFSDAKLQKLGLKDLQESYEHAIDGAANRNDPSGPDDLGVSFRGVCDQTLPLDAKRSILMNWASTEYLIDQATNDGMPENNRPSRLDKLEQGLLALEAASSKTSVRLAGRPGRSASGLLQSDKPEIDHGRDGRHRSGNRDRFDRASLAGAARRRAWFDGQRG